MENKIKKSIFIFMLSIMLYLTFSMFCNVNAASNALTAGYGLKNLNLAPRVTINKNYTQEKGESTSSYLALYIEDDREVLKKFTTSSVYTYTDGTTASYSGTYCFEPGCTNTSHYHYNGSEDVTRNNTNLLRI